MGLGITSADLARVRRTQEILLAPLAPADRDGHVQRAAARSGWVRAAAAAVRALIHAEHATVLASGAPPEILHSTLPRAARNAYVEYYAARDLATPRALRQGLAVAHLLDVMAPDEFYRSELYHDYAVPQGLHDAMLLRTDPAAGRSVWIALQQARPLASADIERCRALLELVLPAFAAGVRASFRLAAGGHDMVRVMDAVSEPLLVYDETGRRLHENPALTGLLAGEPAAGRIRRRIDSLAAGVARAFGGSGGRSHQGAAAGMPVRAAANVRTRAGRYQATATVMAGVVDDRPLVVVQLTHAPAGALAAPAAGGRRLCERFGLTAREAEVALLLADRLTNREIATTLRISEHTAERHTERVLHKLGVDSRTKVRARLGATDG